MIRAQEHWIVSALAEMQRCRNAHERSTPRAAEQKAREDWTVVVARVSERGSAILLEN